MKKARLFFSFVMIVLITQRLGLSQNLVPNPSFEEHEQCPTFLGAVKSFNLNTSYGVVKEWLANPPDCTPDYYHICGDRSFRVPKNLCGNMPTKEGDAYIGMIMRIGEVHMGHPNDMFYREHITAKLQKTLQTNAMYEVKMYVVLSEYANFAIANIGALFTEQPLIIKENIAYQPQILYQDFITDKQNWVMICDTFIAKGNEKYITIGNFDSYRDKKIRKIDKNNANRKKFNFNRAYYFLDEISVQMIGRIPETDEEILKENLQTIQTEMGVLEKGKEYILNNIFFDFDKSDLLPASHFELNKLYGILSENPSLFIQIIVHTDSIGNEVDNLELSEKRAKSVSKYLIDKGISATRISQKGMGESQAIDTNETEEGRQKNRRVAFVLQ